LVKEFDRRVFALLYGLVDQYLYRPAHRGGLPMSRQAPYQASLLRLLHGVSALLFLGAAASGYWIYDQFDGRWGRIGLPPLERMMDWHHTIGGKALLVLAVFGLYSLTLGRHKLVQAASLKQLTQVNQPMWWQSLHRLVNTFVLGAAILAVGSGSRMQGSWLVNGELDHGLYTLHLSAWSAIGVGVVLHLIMTLKVGGFPLLLSIFSTRIRANDTPKHWSRQVTKFLKRG
jgi:Prokaryotic cytochrome b561